MAIGETRRIGPTGDGAGYTWLQTSCVNRRVDNVGPDSVRSWTDVRYETAADPHKKGTCIT